MDKREYLQFVLNNLRLSGVVHSQRDFANLLGINETNLSRAIKGDERYLTDKLIAKVKEAEKGNYAIPSSLVQEFPSLDGMETPINDNLMCIPILPTSARAGSLADFSESVKAYECEKMVSPVKGVDFAMQVTGDSMSPEFPNGSHILIKKIDPTAFIPYGNVLVLDTCNGAVIKQIFPTDKEDIVECRSLNPLYPPFKVKVDSIYGWYRVLMCLALK